MWRPDNSRPGPRGQTLGGWRSGLCFLNPFSPKHALRFPESVRFFHLIQKAFMFWSVKAKQQLKAAAERARSSGETTVGVRRGSLCLGSPQTVLCRNAGSYPLPRLASSKGAPSASQSQAFVAAGGCGPHWLG